MKNRSDMVIGLVLIIFSSLIYGQTARLSDNPSPGGLSPASFPRSLAIIIGFLGIGLMFRRRTEKETEETGSFVGARFGKTAGFFLVIMGYVWLMPRIGFTVSTLSFVMAAGCLIMPKRSGTGFLTVLAFSILAAVSVYMIFSIFLGVPVIEGPVDMFLKYRVFVPPGAG